MDHAKLLELRRKTEEWQKRRHFPNQSELLTIIEEMLKALTEGSPQPDKQ